MQDSHGPGLSSSVSLGVSVHPSQPRHNKAMLAGAVLPVPARCGPGPVLVRQRDDIVVDARLQLLDLLGCCLCGEHALGLGHRCIRHCCRGEGSVLPLTI